MRAFCCLAFGYFPRLALKIATFGSLFRLPVLLFGVMAVAIVTHRFIHRFTQAIDPANRPMRLNTKPRIERLVVACRFSAGVSKSCAGSVIRATVSNGASLSLPLDAGVLDRHVLVGVLTLNLQDETRWHPIRRQLLVQRTAQEVRQILILPGRVYAGQLSGSGITRNLALASPNLYGETEK